ncbi:MAG: hypothetical protein WBO36_04830, partial [Saprospiraceae bacterium]
MILFFRTASQHIYSVSTIRTLIDTDLKKLIWLFGEADFLEESSINQSHVGPRASMVTPWSTNAVEITQNMDISGIERIEAFLPFTDEKMTYDKMLFQKYDRLDQHIFTLDTVPEQILGV